MQDTPQMRLIGIMREVRTVLYQEIGLTVLCTAIVYLMTPKFHVRSDCLLKNGNEYLRMYNRNLLTIFMINFMTKILTILIANHHMDILGDSTYHYKGF